MFSSSLPGPRLLRIVGSLARNGLSSARSKFVNEMMRVQMNQPKVVRPSDRPAALKVVGDEYASLATGEDTGGSYYMMHAVVHPGGGPTPHVQTREEEGFYVLEGEVTFWIEGQRQEAPAGTLLHVPRDVAHSFKNESDAVAKMLIWFAPAGIEDMFPRMAADPQRYQEIGAEFGVQFVEMDQP